MPALRRNPQRAICNQIVRAQGKRRQARGSVGILLRRQPADQLVARRAKRDANIFGWIPLQQRQNAAFGEC